MIRNFSTQQLDAMCKQRPPGYRADVMATATPKLGVPGMFEFDDESAEYRAFKLKYSGKAPVPVPVQPAPSKAPKPYDYKSKPPYSHSEIIARSKVMGYEQLSAKSDGISALLGGLGGYSMALQAFRKKEAGGGCKSCARPAALRALYAGFKNDLVLAPKETLIKLKELLGGEYLEIIPTPLKWDDIIGKAS